MRRGRLHAQVRDRARQSARQRGKNNHDLIHKPP
nr:MAG TPA: hypothetical protein [Caudoviricetes sp.]